MEIFCGPYKQLHYCHSTPVSDDVRDDVRDNVCDDVCNHVCDDVRHDIRDDVRDDLKWPRDVVTDGLNFKSSRTSSRM